MLAVLGVVGFLASAGIAFAQTTATSFTATARPTVLQVNRNGGVLMRGVVTSVATDSVVVKSWGGDWTVNVPSSAKVMPQGVSVSSFQVGDFVGVLGTVESNTSLTVDATLVRDWSARQALTQQTRTNVQTVRQMESARPRVVEGTLSSLDATAQTFTLTNTKGTAYAVSLSSGAKILARNWATLDLSKASNGDTVRVYGTVSGSTISALVFRDVSVK